MIADPFGAAIVDHQWLESGGQPKLIWNAAGFVDYEKYSYLANYVPAWRNGAMGSGPFMIDYVANPDAVVLKPNFLAMIFPPNHHSTAWEYTDLDSRRHGRGCIMRAP